MFRCPIQIHGGVLREPVGPQWLRQCGIEFGRVVRINLNCTKITDDGLKHLNNLTDFQKLLLYDTEITDDGLEHLDSLNNLQKLWLEDTRISDEGLKHLRSLESLKALTLYGTEVTEDGVKMLQESLPNCKIGR